MSGLDETSRDLIIRTIIGEAANQGPIGQAAVAHVIRNRLATGKYGDTGAGVVLAKNQFEPWDARAGSLMGISPSDPKYQRAAQIVDGVWGGRYPDPTRGSTHFFAPAAQAALGRNAPSWARGQGIKIGDHMFYAPNGPAAPDAASFWANPMGATTGGGMSPTASDPTPGQWTAARMPAAPSPDDPGMSSTAAGATPTTGGMMAPPKPMGAPTTPAAGIFAGLQQPRPPSSGSTPFLGRMMFGDGGLPGMMNRISTPANGQGFLGQLFSGMNGAAGGAAGSAAPSLAGPMASAAGAGSSAIGGATQGLGQLLTSLFAAI